MTRTEKLQARLQDGKLDVGRTVSLPVGSGTVWSLAANPEGYSVTRGRREWRRESGRFAWVATSSPNVVALVRESKGGLVFRGWFSPGGRFLSARGDDFVAFA